MRLNKWSLALLACSIAAAGTAVAEQRVDMVNLTRNGTAVPGTPPAALFVKAGDVIKFDASLTQNGAAGDNAAKTTGLGLCLEYNVANVGNPTVASLFTAEYIGANPPTPQNPPNCTAGGSATIGGADTVVITPWTSIGGTFPQGVTLPVKLYDATFTIPAGFAGSALIGFAASSTGNGNNFVSNSAAAIVPLALCSAPTVTVAKGGDGAEPNVNGSFTVTLSAAVPASCGTGGNFPVTLTLGGTATLTADYTVGGTGVTNAANTVTVNFPADGATLARTVNIVVVDDALVEGTETVTAAVAAGSGNYNGVGAAAASINILDDDSGVSVAVTQDGAEGSQGRRQQG